MRSSVDAFFRESTNRVELGVSTEMGQDAHLKCGRAEIADELGTGGRVESRRGLGFDDHTVIDQHIEALARDEPTRVTHGGSHLGADPGVNPSAARVGFARLDSLPFARFASS
jgi:hypothetical protein